MPSWLSCEFKESKQQIHDQVEEDSILTEIGTLFQRVLISNLNIEEKEIVPKEWKDGIGRGGGGLVGCYAGNDGHLSLSLSLSLFQWEEEWSGECIKARNPKFEWRADGVKELPVLFFVFL